MPQEKNKNKKNTDQKKEEFCRLCESCTRECKQPANVNILSCPKYANQLELRLKKRK